MGGRASKQKGKRGEYEVRDLLQEVVNDEYAKANLEAPVLKRNLEQVREGGADIAGLEWLALEVKYREQPNVEGWWRQAKEQGEKVKREPVLIHRANHQAWRVRMYGYLQPAGGKERIVAPVDITVEAFLAYARIRIRHAIANQVTAA